MQVRGIYRLLILADDGNIIICRNSFLKEIKETKKESYFENRKNFFKELKSYFLKDFYKIQNNKLPQFFNAKQLLVINSLVENLEFQNFRKLERKQKVKFYNVLRECNYLNS